MKKVLLFLFLLALNPGTHWVTSASGLFNIFMAANIEAAITSNGTGGGAWSSPATWDGGLVPTSTDDVIIAASDIIEIETNADCLGLSISGTLIYNDLSAFILTAAGDITINSGGTFQTPATGTVITHVLSAGGNLTNNGFLDFSTNGNTAGCGIIFTGAANNSFSGTGATTNIKTLTINKGTAQTNILELNPTNFTVQGSNTDGAQMAFLTLTNGTLKISGTFTLAGRAFTSAAYSIPATTGFWLNNPNFTVAGQAGTSTCTGLLRITQGTFNIGTALNESMGFLGGATIIVEGGAVNSASGFGVGAVGNAITYTQTNGVITVCTVGNSSTSLASFDLGNSNSSVISMTGGTIIVQLANTGGSGPRDYRVQSGPTGVGGNAITGGTLQLGNNLSGTAKAFNLAGLLPNVVLTNTSASHSATVLTPAVFNNFSRNITINSGTTLNLGNNVFLFAGDTILNNGTLTHSGTSSRFITFKSAKILYTGSGTLTTPVSSLELQNDSSFTIDAASSNIVILRIIIFSGSFINANKITLGNGGATTGAVQIGNTTTPTLGGTFDQELNYNLGTGGQTLSCLRTTIPITLDKGINPTRLLTTLRIDPDVNKTVTLSGGSLQVKTTLTMTSGFFNLGNDTLTLGQSTSALGTLSTTSGIIGGKFKRWVSSGSADFPVGIISASMVSRKTTIGFETAPTTGGTLMTEWVSTPGGLNGLPLTEGSINVTKSSDDGFWRITSGDGYSGGIYNITCIGTGVESISDYTKLVLLKRTDSNSSWTLDGVHATTSGSNTAPVLLRVNISSGFSEFGIGSDSTINALPVELTSFTVVSNRLNAVLNWRTATEVDNYGFEIQRSLKSVAGNRNDSPSYEAESWEKIGFVKGNGNSNSSRDYSYIDQHLTAGKYFYRLKQIDNSGLVKYSNEIETEIGTAPAVFNLAQNYPNPFNPETILEFTVPENGMASLRIYNALGEEVAVLFNEITEAGKFNQVKFNASTLASGIYYAKLQFGSSQLMKKMVYLK